MIREQGAKLASKGYAVIPVRPNSKIPSILSWQKNPLSEQDCLSRPKDEGVGLLCGYGDHPLLGIDCDIEDDADLAASVRNRFDTILHFEETNPIRHGKRPKFMILGAMKSDERFSKMSSVKYTKDGGKTTVQVEMLGVGHYFVAYGIHPDTGKAYEWEEGLMGAGPEDWSPSDFAPIALEDLKACIAAFEEEVSKRGGYQPVGLATGSTEVLDWTSREPQKAPMELKPHFVEKVLEDLTTEKKIDADSYDNWLQVGMALHHQFAGDVEGLNIWDTWSASSAKYKPGVCATKWATFGKYPAKMKTMRSFVYAWYALGLNGKYSFCETGIVHRIIRESGDRIRFLADANRFRECNKLTGRWIDTDDVCIQHQVFNQIEYGLEDEAKDIKEQGFEERATALLSFRSKCRASMSRVLTSVCKDMKATTTAKFADFDADPNLFGVGNGVLDLAKGRFLGAKPELMISKGSFVDYVDGARNARWEQFIQEVTGGDETTADYLQRVVGYAMSGVPNQHLMFFLIGRGCNGKSVFLNTLSKVFGSYHKAVPADYFTMTEKQVQGTGKGPDATLVSMAGSRLCVSAETALGASMQEAVIKRLVSRDVLTARALYSNSVMEIIPTWVLFVATNHFPDVRTRDKGTWRRIRAIEFGVDFDDGKHEMDPWLEDKLAQNLPGILNWCIEGYRKYRKYGLTQSDSAKAFTEQLQEQGNYIGRWLADKCVKSANAEVLLKDAFASWRAWSAKEGGFEYCPNDKVFGQSLVECGFNKHKTNKGLLMQGFRLLTDEELAARQEAEDEEEIKELFA